MIGHVTTWQKMSTWLQYLFGTIAENMLQLGNKFQRMERYNAVIVIGR